MSQVQLVGSPRFMVAGAGARLPPVVHAVTGTLVLPRRAAGVVPCVARGWAVTNVEHDKATPCGWGNHVRPLKSAGDGDYIPLRLVATVDLIELVEQKTHRVRHVLRELSLRHAESHGERPAKEKHRERLHLECLELLVQKKRGDLTIEVAVDTLIHIQSGLKVLIGSPIDIDKLDMGSNLPGSFKEESPAVTLVLDMIRELDEVFQAYDEYKQGCFEAYINAGDRAI